MVILVVELEEDGDLDEREVGEGLWQVRKGGKGGTFLYLLRVT